MRTDCIALLCSTLCNGYMGKESEKEGIYIYGFPWWLSGKEPVCSAGNTGSVSGLGRSSGEGKRYPLLYSGLRIPWTV